MGIGTSILMGVAGTLLRFQAAAQIAGFKAHASGVVLMIAGAVGVVASLVFWNTWGGFGWRNRARSGDTVFIDRVTVFPRPTQLRKET